MEVETLRAQYAAGSLSLQPPATGQHPGKELSMRDVHHLPGDIPPEEGEESAGLLAWLAAAGPSGDSAGACPAGSSVELERPGTSGRTHSPTESDTSCF